MEPWVYLATWLALSVGGGPAAPPSSSPKEALVYLLNETSGATSDERIAVARLAGLGKWQTPTLSEQLGLCAQTNRPEAAACMMALVARGDVEQLPAIRSGLRTATDPAVVAAGCTALSAFSDGHSRSLVMSAILRQKGGTLGGMACAGALDRLNKWTNARYELFAWRFLTQPALRNFMASQVLRHTTQANRSSVESDLLENTQRLLGLPTLSQTEVQAVALGVCAMNQGPKSLGKLADEKLDPLLRSLPPGSAGRSAVCQLARELCGVRFMACAATSDTPGRQAPKQPLVLRDKLRVLQPDGLWYRTNKEWNDLLLDSPRVKALGLTADTLRPLFDLPPQPKKRLAALWSPEVLLDSASAKKPRPIPWGLFHKRYAKEVFSEEFLKFVPALKQPAWLAPTLYLTIDDGPSLVNLPGILDTLERHNVKAIFFFVGVNIISHYASHPDTVRKLIQRLLDQGHVIGYHTMEHALSWPNHIVYWDLDQVTDDVELFKTVLSQAAGRSVPIVYGRSPGGTGTHMGTLKKAFQVSGLMAPVGWNREFRSHVGMGEVYGSAQALATNPVNAVVLMHEYFSTPKVIDFFLTTYQHNRKNLASEAPTGTPTATRPAASTPSTHP